MDASGLERAAKALREIELSALAHHEHEGKMTLLHALQVEIPKMAEDARAAIAAPAQAEGRGAVSMGEVASSLRNVARRIGLASSPEWVRGEIERIIRSLPAAERGGDAASLYDLWCGNRPHECAWGDLDAASREGWKRVAAILTHRAGRPACDEWSEA